jgi:hypothetical protein
VKSAKGVFDAISVMSPTNYQLTGMIWLKIWACHDSHSLFFGYLITLMWILFGRHGPFLTDLCIHSMVILPLSEYVVRLVECFFVWQLRQLQKQNEELRQQESELNQKGTHMG